MLPLVPNGAVVLQLTPRPAVGSAVLAVRYPPVQASRLMCKGAVLAPAVAHEVAWQCRIWEEQHLCEPSCCMLLDGWILLVDDGCWIACLVCRKLLLQLLNLSLQCGNLLTAVVLVLVFFAGETTHYSACWDVKRGQD